MVKGFVNLADSIGGCCGPALLSAHTRVCCAQTLLHNQPISYKLHDQSVTSRPAKESRAGMTVMGGNQGRLNL